LGKPRFTSLSQGTGVALAADTTDAANAAITGKQVRILNIAISPSKCHCA